MDLQALNDFLGKAMKIEYVWTEDNLRLMGSHYQGSEVCVLEIHGMSGNFIENYYANVLGEKLAAKGYGFIYGHNRGYCHVNDIATKPVKSDENGDCILIEPTKGVPLGGRLY